MTPERLLVPAVMAAIAAPLGAFVLLFLTAASGHRPRERVVGGIATAAFALTAAAGLFAALLHAATGAEPRHVSLAPWFGVGAYRFELGVGVDRLSLVYLGLIGFLSAIVGQFSHRYLHREPGYRRFFVLLTLFSGGMCVLVMASTLDLLFVGWELVGVASALLIAFYQERHAPARHGLFAFVVYRICDVGLLAAVVLLHHVTASGVLPIGASASALPAASATFFGLLVLLGSMGKAGQLPFSSWLPRAMEGPTTSSAIFYGALSTHAGPYLLLRTAPLWSDSVVVSAAIGLVGLTTAIHASVIGRVQTDAKTALAYSTLAQIGLIYVEIALGLHTLALAHVVGNALLRSLQILRAPSVIDDHERLENALGRALPRRGVHLEVLFPERVRLFLYRLALERGYLEALGLSVLDAMKRVLRAFDRFDRRLVQAIGGHPAPAPTDDRRPAAIEATPEARRRGNGALR